jgi:hypothetical protein
VKPLTFTVVHSATSSKLISITRDLGEDLMLDQVECANFGFVS